MRLLLFFYISMALLTLSPPSHALYKCSNVYTVTVEAKGNIIQFTQPVIGKLWAEYKSFLLEGKFNSWLKQSHKGTREQFLMEEASKKPFPAIIDKAGVIRIVDNHHRFYAMTLFYGKEIDFKISFKILKDYSTIYLGPNGISRWSEKSMVKDMREHNFIGKIDGKSPNPRWFNRLPETILDMGDSPLRSLMSFVLESFPTPLKGSDFVPHIQNFMGGQFLKIGIKVFTKNTFSKQNIERLRKEIQNNPELHRPMIDKLGSESRSSEKLEEIIKMLSGSPISREISPVNELNQGLQWLYLKFEVDRPN